MYVYGSRWLCRNRAEFAGTVTTETVCCSSDLSRPDHLFDAAVGSLWTVYRAGHSDVN